MLPTQAFRVVNRFAGRADVARAMDVSRSQRKVIGTEVRCVVRRALELAESHSAARFVRPVVVFSKKIV